MLQISELYIYPIKSLPGIAVKNAKVTARGFEHDRRWMLVDECNRFLTQRELPLLTQFKVSIGTDGLLISHPSKNAAITIPFKSFPSAESAQVIIWDDTCTGEFVSNAVDEWFSVILGVDCRLVHMPDKSKRAVDQRFAPTDAMTSFADAYPYLIIGQASLEDLNGRLNVPLPMNRFRPNIVFTGGEPYQEDCMNDLIIGDVKFKGVKLCARCIITTIDQKNGLKAKEPLKTLATYRSKNHKILFGQNLIGEGDGIVCVGDELHALSIHHEERFIVAENTGTTPTADIAKTFVNIVN